MTYIFENTSPERFQEFCQSLLLAEYPGLQCFPVAQPDGGRDALHPGSNTVLQVKFRRADEPESADWMIDALANELPKIRRLVEAGAEQYVMVTNARGTAHPDSGRIDRVQRWLGENLPCPAICLWRDDLDRRFDLAPESLKFKYPELLTGQDGIQLALGKLLGGRKTRQMRAIRAFVGEQFEADSKVKFRQLHLSNTLADLFIDIPVRFNDAMLKQIHRKLGKDADVTIRKIMRVLDPVPDEISYAAGAASRIGYRARAGTAELLLSEVAQQHLTRIVLEGAPGQGKSTLAQFVCQVHRAAFLGDTSFQESIPTVYVRSSFRLPFKVDLRDLAAFIGQKTGGATSLDEFLCDLVRRLSGGQKFSVDDLLDVLDGTPGLIFLDGLDEVADLEQRRALVTVVEKSIQRYETLGLDMQVVVTSRPSVFGRKANFDSAGFVTIDLASIDRRLAMTYSKKWVAARALDDFESQDVLTILNDKLEMPHIVELTRNAMQLTILLSLIHQVGYSLPDQRTDLYRRYLELFLIRESEKDAAVKKHQAVLIEFIQFLAWMLQSQAESAGSRGSISEVDLQDLAREYLVAAKHPPELADNLFGGGLERIFVLVQRISGLYEFEVQPLREFFCARHLYETSPVGTYRYQSPKGDRAQRFEALAANPFWLNVTRFYAGSYESGEIGSLVLSLKDLIVDSDPGRSLHGRQVAFALLSDWVFANKKSWQDELIRAACDEAGVHLLVQMYHEGEPLALDEECGRDTLRDIVFEALVERSFGRDSLGYCRLLEINGGEDLVNEFEKTLDSTQGRGRTLRFGSMLKSGGARRLPTARTLELAMADDPDLIEIGERLSLIVEASGPEIEREAATLNLFVMNALEGSFLRGPRRLCTIGVFADLLSAYPSDILPLYAHREPSVLAEQAEELGNFGAPASLLPKFLASVSASMDPRMSPHSAPTWEQLSVVSDLVREVFGRSHWAAYLLALRAAGLPTSASVNTAARLFDDDRSLAERAKYARLKRRSAEWWREALRDGGSVPNNRVFWSALVLSWSSPKMFEALLEDLQAVVGDLSGDAFVRLEIALRSVARDATQRSDRRGYVPPLSQMSDRLFWLSLIAFRLSPADLTSRVRGRDIPHFTRWTEDHGISERLLEVPVSDASDTILGNWLRRVRSAQTDGVPLPVGVAEHCREATISMKLADKMVRNPGLYPNDAVLRAHELVMTHYDPPILTVVAAREEWVFQG